jgi:hypothetical protein
MNMLLQNQVSACEEILPMLQSGNQIFSRNVQTSFKDHLTDDYEELLFFTK